MPVADILGGLFGGLSQGLGDIVQQRNRQQIVEQQQQEQDRLRKQQEFEMLKAQLDLTPTDVPIDPADAQRYMTAGFGSALGKNEQGQVIRRPDIRQQVDQMRINTERLNQQLLGGQITESERSRQLRDRIQSEGGMNWLMAHPITTRQAISKMAGIETPMTNEELAAENLAKSSGRLAEQQIASNAMVSAAGMRQNATNSQETMASFEAWLKRMYSQDARFRQAHDEAKEAGEYQEFMEHAMNVYRKLPIK